MNHGIKFTAAENTITDPDEAEWECNLAHCIDCFHAYVRWKEAYIEQEASKHAAQHT